MRKPGLKFVCVLDLEIDMGGLRIGADLKTISMWNIKQEGLRAKLHREIIERDYHLSAAMYCETAALDQFFWIFVNKDENYHWIAIIEASEELLELGMLEYRKAMRAIANGFDTGEWPAPITEDYTEELNDFDMRRPRSSARTGIRGITMSNLVATTENQTQKIDNVSILTNGELFNRLRTLSEVMANSGNFVPEHYRGKPDACMAVVMQAARWGMDPFAVAQKTFIVGNSGVLGYEAQLVNAVINTMAPTKDRIHFEWFGAWENIVGRFIKKTSGKGNDYIVPGWDLQDEAGVGVRAWATLKGRIRTSRACADAFAGTSPQLYTVGERPRQQLAYLAVKRWARLYCPDVIPRGLYRR